jgi:hypothetical protein
LKVEDYEFNLQSRNMAKREDIERLLSWLASAPGRFEAAISRLEDADSVTSAGPDEWSPADVLAHVRASQDILEPRIFQILVRDNPPLPAFDDRLWAEVARYVTLPVIESLEAMRLRRNELVRALRAISEADWQRTGTHELRGPLTVFAIASHIADHEEEHVAQIEGSNA